MLRANLIQPLLDANTLNMRLDCLDELVSNEDMAYSLQQCLSRLPKDLDRLDAPIANVIPAVRQTYNTSYSAATLLDDNLQVQEHA